MKRPSTKFIILSMRRSGSNNLSYLLDSHPEIFSIGEVFCIEKIWGEPGLKWMNHNRFLKLLRDKFPILFLKIFVFGFQSFNYQATGFRFFYEHILAFPQLAEHLLKDKGLKVIHLRRKNLFENLVSLELAKETGAWSTLRNKEYGDKTIVISPRVCLDHFKTSLENIIKYKKMFASQPTLELTYEDFVGSPLVQTKRILEFLGQKQLELVSPLEKQNTRKLSQIVTNYDQLKLLFKNSRARQFFTE